jgi:AcrR family transcriptional regulator
MTTLRKTGRRYDSPYRREQAARTRRAILDAAERFFSERGYLATSLADIAKEARISLKTVQAIFGTKTKLFADLVDRTIAGDEAAIPVAERDWFREMIEAADPHEQLRLHARNSCQVKHRAGALLEALHRSAQSDPEIAARWNQMQNEFLENQTLIARSLASKGALRPDLDVAEAAERIWTLNHPTLYYLLVHERGWSAERYEQWLADAFISQVLDYNTGR